MAIVTLTTDFGDRDAYASILKATLLKHDPSITIVDIGHNVSPSNIAEGAFLLGSAYTNFPEGTVHLVAVDTLANRQNTFIAMEMGGHVFVGADNGLLSLLSELEPEKVVLISKAEHTTFPSRDILAPAAAKLAAGSMLEDIGEIYSEMRRFLRRAIKATREEIIGHVVHIDHYGNLITNIPKRDFDILSKDKKYEVIVGKEYVYQLNTSPSEVEAGDCFVLFNHLDVLEVGIKNGHAARLLGMQFDSTIRVKFSE